MFFSQKSSNEKDNFKLIVFFLNGKKNLLH